MGDRWKTDGLADRVSRLIFAVDEFNREPIRNFCDEIEALANENAALKANTAPATDLRFYAAGPWIDDDHCAYRVFYGRDGRALPDIPRNRACFIEKAPRVNVPSTYIDPPERIDRVWVAKDVLTGRLTLRQGEVRFVEGPGHAHYSNESWWHAGPKGRGEECGQYQPSRDWCDATLRRFGVKLHNSHTLGQVAAKDER